MRFSEIGEVVQYPPQYKAKIQTVVSDIISYVSTHIPERLQGKRDIISCINRIAYLIISGDGIPVGWSVDMLCDGLPTVSDTTIMDTLGNCFIYLTDVVWDIQENSAVMAAPKIVTLSSLNSGTIPSIHTDKAVTPTVGNSTVEKSTVDSTIEDIALYPKAPQFDIKNINMSKVVDDLQYVLYNSVPTIPTRQCEISMTTNVDAMTDKELLALFPNRILYPRSAELYAEIDGVERDDILGNLITVGGWSKKQMIDNIIRYPYIHNLKRLGRTPNGYRQVDFWKYMEVDGEMHKTLDVWDTHKKFSGLPKNKAVIEDVVVRNYLLKQSSKSKDKYQFGIYGELLPHLMLFLPIDVYADFGYKDPVDLARQCVISRVAYIRSRNPVLQKLTEGKYFNV